LQNVVDTFNSTSRLVTQWVIMDHHRCLSSVATGSYDTVTCYNQQRICLWQRQTQLDHAIIICIMLLSYSQRHLPNIKQFASFKRVKPVCKHTVDGAKVLHRCKISRRPARPYWFSKDNVWTSARAQTVRYERKWRYRQAVHSSWDVLVICAFLDVTWLLSARPAH